MDVGPSNLKKRNHGAFANGAWTCSNPDNSRDEMRSSNLFQVDSLFVEHQFLLSKKKTSMKLMLHFLVSEGFCVLDCGATTSFLVALRALKHLFS